MHRAPRDSTKALRRFASLLLLEPQQGVSLRRTPKRSLEFSAAKRTLAGVVRVWNGGFLPVDLPGCQIHQWTRKVGLIGSPFEGFCRWFLSFKNRDGKSTGPKWTNCVAIRKWRLGVLFQPLGWGWPKSFDYPTCNYQALVATISHHSCWWFRNLAITTWHA